MCTNSDQKAKIFCYYNLLTSFKLFYNTDIEIYIHLHKTMV